MEHILNNPIVKQFLKRFPSHDYIHTLKDLILIGINIVLTKLSSSFQIHINNFLQNKSLQNNTPNHNQHHTQIQENQLVMRQISLIKNQIKKINQKFNSNLLLLKPTSTQIQKIALNNQLTFNNDLINKYATVKERKKSVQITPKVTQVHPQLCKIYPTTQINRHHLDDAQLKQILSYKFIQSNKKQKTQKSNRIMDLSLKERKKSQKIFFKKKSGFIKIESIKTQKSYQESLKKNKQTTKIQNNKNKNCHPNYKTKSAISEQFQHSNLKVIQKQKMFIRSKLLQKGESRTAKDELKSNESKGYNFNKTGHIKLSMSSKIEEANRFLRSPLGQNLCNKVQKQLDSSQDNEMMQRNMDNKQNIGNNSNDIQLQNYETRKIRKNIGKISRKQQFI